MKRKAWNTRAAMLLHLPRILADYFEGTWREGQSAADRRVVFSDVCRRYRSELTGMNLARLIPSAVALMALEILCMILDTVHNTHGGFVVWFYLMEALLFLLGLGTLLFSLRLFDRGRASHTRYRWVYRAFWVLLMLMSLAIYLLN